MIFSFGKITFNEASLIASYIFEPKEIKFDIPGHINLLDFYETYGRRLSGSENIKIISREEWETDNFSKNGNFAKNFCRLNYCREKEYDAEGSFSNNEYLKSRVLMLNYRNNFKHYDNTFLQKLKKENGVIYEYLPVEEFVIHHTAGRFTVLREDSLAELKRIYTIHSLSRKWQDIGYHYLIDGNGRVFEGNLGGKYAIGSHTYGHNRGNVAIALMGDFRPGHNQLNQEMKNSLSKLINYLIKEYKLDISKNYFFLRKPDFNSREKTNLFIKGHNELDIRDKPTACPGIDPEELRKMIYPVIFL